MKKKLTMGIITSLFLMGAASLANAALILSVEGVAGTGFTTWSLSGSSTVNQDGTIRTNVGSDNFSLDDTFEPDVTGDFITNGTSIPSDALYSITGSAFITVGTDTQAITNIYLDQDGSRDDFGIRTTSALSYLTGETSSWTGSFNVGLDIGEFNVGSYQLNTTQLNGGGFLFALPNEVQLNFTESGPNPVPEPTTMILFGSGLAGLVGTRMRKKKK